MSLMMDKQELAEIYNRQTEAWKTAKKGNVLEAQISAIEETLLRFGLLKNEVKVYLQLARVGEMKAADLAEAISLHRTETYKILRDLEKKGIVFAIFEKPLKFTAVPLDKAVDLLVDAQKVQIKLLEQEKTSLVDLWRSIPKPKVTEQKKEMFQMLEGEEQVLTKVSELLEKTENEFQIFAAADYLSQLYYSDFSEELKAQAEKVSVTLVTDTSFKSAYFMGQLSWISDTNRISNDQSLPCFIVSDNKEVLIIFHEDVVNNADNRKKYRTAAIWTNYTAFVKILKELFSKIR
jgi:HTH-type transcriptional regulator, sugar sensing transcriptional regulator